MTHKEFIFWLKGIVDTTDSKPSKKIWKLIQDKLKTVEETDFEEKMPDVYITPHTTPTPQEMPPNPGNPPNIWC